MLPFTCRLPLQSAVAGCSAAASPGSSGAVSVAATASGPCSGTGSGPTAGSACLSYPWPMAGSAGTAAGAAATTVLPSVLLSAVCSMLMRRPCWASVLHAPAACSSVLLVHLHLLSSS
eukprot:9356952-Heterocapsa_arctica.AAC.1